MDHKIQRFPNSRAAGFSLIEVTIAMAIAAVALVTLIGLLPQGMNTMMAAGDEAIQGRIHQQILNEMQMVSFDRLSEYNKREFYYDAQGEELGDSDGESGGDFEHIYSARTTVASPEGAKMPASVGGGNFSGFSFDGGTDKTTILLPVVIEVAAVGGRGKEFDWDDSDNRRLISTYQTYVVKMGTDL